MPRHGRKHELPPAQINYRANVWAMKELGVRRIIGPVRVRRAAGGPRARRVRRLRPVRRPHDRARGHVLRGARDDARLPGGSVLRRSARDPRRDGPRARSPGARRRHRRRHPGPALLDPRRVGVVPAHGLGRDQHDRVPGGLSRARARALLREHLDGDRPRRRRRVAPSRVSHETVLRVFTENNERLRELLFAAIPRIGQQPDDACATALQGARVS